MKRLMKNADIYKGMTFKIFVYVFYKNLLKLQNATSAFLILAEL